MAILIVVRFALMLFSLVATQNGGVLMTGTKTVIAADATRYHIIATSRGTPYRDFQVEYPPVALGEIEALSHGTVGTTTKLLGFVGLALDVLVVVMLLIGWGERTAITYLVLGTPLALFAYFRVDLLATALATFAVFQLYRGRDRSSGMGLMLGVFTKVWPFVIAPLFVVRRSWKALAWFGGSTLLALLAWTIWGGWRGPTQVIGFRGANGWQVESTVGSILWTFTHSRVHVQAGALRVGSTPFVAKGGLFLLGAAVIAWAWVMVNRATHADRRTAEGLACLVSVAALMVTAPILSPQYMVWLLPWAAIGTAAGRDRLLAGCVAAVTTLTTLMWFLPIHGRLTFQSLVLARNAAVLAAVLVGLQRLKGASAAVAREQEPVAA